MISALSVLVQKIRHVSFDWFLFGGIFLVSFFIFVGFLYIAKKVGTLSEQQPEHRPTPPALPDTSVRDSDPKVYVEFHDDRGSVTKDIPDAVLDLVNRGGRTAKMVCIEDIWLKEYVITFPKVGHAIIPGNGSIFAPNIVDNSKQAGYAKNMIQAFMREWFTYNDYSKHELAFPVIVTYQDDQRNLFETYCELILHPDQEAKVKTTGVVPGIKVVDTRNCRFRKLAAAIGSSVADAISA